MKKWFKFCSFCDLKDNQHDKNCVWRKTFRAAKWSVNGLAVVLDGRLMIL